ncbi:MAG: GYD domain-containing protein [Gemmatimonadales bacterium]
MPRYLLQFAYTADTWAALAKNPVDRRPAVRAVLEKVGGRLIDLYYHFGEYDGVAILEAPDDTAANAAVIAVSAPGHLKATRTTRLFSVEEAMEAMRKAGGIPYQAPSAK